MRQILGVLLSFSILDARAILLAEEEALPTLSLSKEIDKGADSAGAVPFPDCVSVAEALGIEPKLLISKLEETEVESTTPTVVSDVETGAAVDPATCVEHVEEFKKPIEHPELMKPSPKEDELSQVQEVQGNDNKLQHQTPQMEPGAKVELTKSATTTVKQTSKPPQPNAVKEVLGNVEILPFVSTADRDARIQKVVDDCDQYITKALCQKTNVHHTDSYYKPLWRGLNNLDILGYQSKDSEEFQQLFHQTVREIQFVIQHINTGKLVSIAGVDMLLNLPVVYKKANIEQALLKMRQYGKHAGASDWDNEIHAHVNQVLVYVWQEVKRDPKDKLPEFLKLLNHAGPTCIQGHTIRMLQSVHDYTLRPKCCEFW